MISWCSLSTSSIGWSGADTPLVDDRKQISDPHFSITVEIAQADVGTAGTLTGHPITGIKPLDIETVRRREWCTKTIHTTGAWQFRIRTLQTRGSLAKPGSAIEEAVRLGPLGQARAIDTARPQRRAILQELVAAQVGNRIPRLGRFTVATENRRCHRRGSGGVRHAPAGRTVVTHDATAQFDSAAASAVQRAPLVGGRIPRDRGRPYRAGRLRHEQARTPTTAVLGDLTMVDRERAGTHLDATTVIISLVAR